MELSDREPVFFQDDLVLITTERAIFGTRGYQIPDIITVKIWTDPPMYVSSAAMILFGSARLVFWPQVGHVASFGGLIFLLFGVFLAVRTRHFYRLIIGVSGKEFTVTASASRDYMVRLHRALSESICLCGNSLP